MTHCWESGAVMQDSADESQSPCGWVETSRGPSFWDLCFYNTRFVPGMKNIQKSRGLEHDNVCIGGRTASLTNTDLTAFIRDETVEVLQGYNLQQPLEGTIIDTSHALIGTSLSTICACFSFAWLCWTNLAVCARGCETDCAGCIYGNQEVRDKTAVTSLVRISEIQLISTPLYSRGGVFVKVIRLL